MSHPKIKSQNQLIVQILSAWLINHIIFLTVLAENAINKNLYKNAIYFFEYALNLCDPDELLYRYKMIKLRYDEIKFKIPESSISLDIEKSIAHEKNIGSIDLKNQFILIDLLKILLDKNGEPISKSELSKALWNESYIKNVHDNKIYVTIKRLKNLIEPDKNSTKYLFRSKNGYFLTQNKDTTLSERFK